MKRLLALQAVTALLAGAAHSESSSRLAAEWFVPLTDAPEKFALVDADTGTVRFASADANAALDWSPPVPTGLAGVTDACAGLPGAAGEILAMASASANRVVLLDATTAAPFPRVLPSLSGIGPSGLAPVGSAPNRRLLIASRSNGTNAGRLETRENLSTTHDLVASNPHATAFRRLQPLTDPGGGPTLAVVTGDSGANTRVELADATVPTFKATYTNIAEFATNVRSNDHPGRLFAIAYRVGSSFAQLVEFSVPLTTASTLTSNPVGLPFPVSAVIPVHGGGLGGNMKDGFLAIAADGSAAALVKVNASADGITGALETFPAEAGTFLGGVLPLPGIGIVKLGSSSPNGPAEVYHSYQWDGSAWVQTDSGALPAIPAPGEMAATLLFYQEDPLVDESARLLGVRQLGAWTRRDSPVPVPATVLAETFPDPATGLTSIGPQPVLAPAGTNYVLTSQFEPGISIAAAGELGGLMAPTLDIEPPSGTYEESFQVTAEYDETRFGLLVRENGGSWETAPENLPVAWSTTLEFTLKSSLDGSLGPILTRQYTLPAASLGDLDSDGDGVPDYVELALGLDPFGGSDSDADGVSDLDEILQGTDPADDASTPLPNETAGVSPEGGIALVATATDASAATEIALGEDLVAYGLDGSLIARAAVATLANPLPDGGTRGAVLSSTSPQPLDGLVALHSPLYFDLVGGARDGRELVGFFPATPPPPFEPAFTPAGSDLSANAAGWIGAAQAAAASRPAADSRSIATPADAALAVLLEEIVHAALSSVRPVGDPPAALEAFTFLPGRAADGGRDFPTGDDRSLLAAAGFDFTDALDLAGSASAAMAATVEGIYQHHADNSATTPGIALPIDAMRLVLRGDPLPSDYAGAVSPANLAAAQAAYAGAVAQFADAFRPSETWTVEILPAPAEAGIYLRIAGGAEVALLNADGTRFLLERGLGLQPGARFSVTGFTDTPPAGPYPTMEITAAGLVSRPAASSNDQDGNLLDDEWEKFFFGETGQDPDAEPHGGGYTLLQYFLDGTDPRGGDLPAGPPVDLTPQLPVLSAAAGGGYHLDFVFPAAYQDQVGFLVERSTSLAAGSWTGLPGIPVASIGGDELRATIPPAEVPPGSAFYRIRLTLAP